MIVLSLRNHHKIQRQDILSQDDLVGDNLSEMWKDASRWKTGDKWRSFGWNVIEIDGHRIEQIDNAIKKATSTKGLPSIIIARTIKGKGVEHMEDNPQWHGKAADPDIAPIINTELDCQFMIAPSIIAGDMSNLENEVKRCSMPLRIILHVFYCFALCGSSNNYCWNSFCRICFFYCII